MIEIVKGKIVLLLLLFTFNQAFGAFELFHDDIISISLSGAGYARSSSGMSSNPAVPIERFSLAFTYRNLYDIPQLKQSSLSLCYKLFNTGLTLKVFDFGWKLYRENALSMSASRQLGENISLGVRMEYYHLSIKDYGSSGCFGIDAGAFYRLSENAAFAVGIANLNHPKIGVCEEAIPLKYQAGAAFKAGEFVEIYGDLFKDGDFPVESCLGLEITPMKNITLRTGVADSPVSFSTGFNVNISKIALYYAFNTHNYLGFTHIFSIALFP